MLYILNVHGVRTWEIEIPSLKRQPGDTIETVKQREELNKSRKNLFWSKYEEYETDGIEFKWALNSSLSREFFCDEKSFRQAKQALHNQGIESFFPLVRYEPKHFVSETLHDKLTGETDPKYIPENKYMTLLRKQQKAAARG